MNCRSLCLTSRPACPPGRSAWRCWAGKKGTTTADLEKKTGLLEQARGGTLLINNVEFLPAELLPRLEIDRSALARRQRRKRIAGKHRKILRRGDDRLAGAPRADHRRAAAGRRTAGGVERPLRPGNPKQPARRRSTCCRTIPGRGIPVN